MKREKYKLMVLECKCTDCGQPFETVALSELVYGPLLLRSASGQHLAMLEPIEDKVFSEVSNLVKSLLPHVTDRMRSSDCLHDVFGMACDHAPDGSVFVLAGPICPVCQSRNVWHRDVHPPQWRVLELPHPTHRQWQTLGAEERRQLIANALRIAGCL